MQEGGQLSDGVNSDNSSQSSGTPGNSRMRRATFPVDNEDVPSQSESSQGSSPRYRSDTPYTASESPKRPPVPPTSPHHHPPSSPLARPPTGFGFQGRSHQANPPRPSGDVHRQATNQSGNLDGQQQDNMETDKQYQSSSAQEIRERRKSVDDGFNSDPEQSSRVMRLQATNSGDSESSIGIKPGTPKHKPIRRVASDAQLLSRYAGRAGTGQRLGSFGSHTSDSTYSFDDYLRNHRTPSPSPKNRQGFEFPYKGNTLLWSAPVPAFVMYACWFREVWVKEGLVLHALQAGLLSMFTLPRAFGMI